MIFCKLGESTKKIKIWFVSESETQKAMLFMSIFFPVVNKGFRPANVGQLSNTQQDCVVGSSDSQEILKASRVVIIDGKSASQLRLPSRDSGVLSLQQREAHQE